MKLLTLAIFLCTCHLAYSADTPQMDTTAQPNMTILEMIEASNPPCPEWLKKTLNYSKLLTSNVRCGKQIRLHKWKCLSTGEIGWTPEVYELEKCK